MMIGAPPAPRRPFQPLMDTPDNGGHRPRFSRDEQAMSELTREDLKTILLFGIHIAKVDGDFDVWEKKILARFAEAMGLTEAEKEQMTHQRISLADGLSHLSGQKAKTLLWKTLCAVSHSDGEAHETEVDFIHKVIEKVGGQIFLHAVKDWGAYEQEVMNELQDKG